MVKVLLLLEHQCHTGRQKHDMTTTLGEGVTQSSRSQAIQKDYKGIPKVAEAMGARLTLGSKNSRDAEITRSRGVIRGINGRAKRVGSHDGPGHPDGLQAGVWHSRLKQGPGSRRPSPPDTGGRS